MFECVLCYMFFFVIGGMEQKQVYCSYSMINGAAHSLGLPLPFGAFRVPCGGLPTGRLVLLRHDSAILAKPDSINMAVARC